MRDFMLIAVIPDIFQRFQVVLNVRVFAVANGNPRSLQRRIRRLLRNRHDVITRVDLLLSHVEVEAVGVVTLYRLRPAPPPNSAVSRRQKRSQRVFTWRAVQTKAVAGLVFPLIHGFGADAPQSRCLWRAKLLAVVQVLAAEQRVNGFMDPM